MRRQNQTATVLQFVNMKQSFVEAFGWYGTCAILLAYALVSFSILSPTNIWYQVLNGTGVVGIIIVSFTKKAYQPGVLNTIWALIALAAILQIFIR